MACTTERIFKIGENVGALGDEGRVLSVYSIGAGTEGRLNAETTANGWPDGRYSIGVNIGAGIVHRGSRAEMADVTD